MEYNEGVESIGATCFRQLFAASIYPFAVLVVSPDICYAHAQSDPAQQDAPRHRGIFSHRVNPFGLPRIRYFVAFLLVCSKKRALNRRDVCDPTKV